MNKNKWHWISIAVIIVFAMLAFGFLVMRNYSDIIRAQKLGVNSDFFTESKEGINLKIPDGPQRQVEIGDHATSGPDTAKITVVGFGDFQCPYCQRAFPIFRFILNKYSNDVRFVYRHFPVADSHPDSINAAMASECARDQGRFWEYHDILFQNPSALAADDLKLYANGLGLDSAKFATCLETSEKKDLIAGDYEAALKAGVQGTPTYFVNGFRVQGFLPVQAWDELFEKFLK